MGYRNVLRKKWWLVFMLAVGVFLIAATTGYCAKITSYSADQVIMDPAGKVISTGKIYMTPKNVRIESHPSEGAETMINIFNIDKKIFLMLNPQAKKYFESVLNEEEMKKAMNQQQVSQNEKVLGTEKVSGYTCTKKSIETTVKFLGMKRKSESIVWVSKSFDYPLRTKSPDGGMTELRKIKPGGQSSKLFAVPAGYEKVGSMIALFAGSATVKKAEGNASDQGSNEGKEEKSFFKFPKDLTDSIQKNMKWPFGDSKKAE